MLLNKSLNLSGGICPYRRHFTFLFLTENNTYSYFPKHTPSSYFCYYIYYDFSVLFLSTNERRALRKKPKMSRNSGEYKKFPLYIMWNFSLPMKPSSLLTQKFSEFGLHCGSDLVSLCCHRMQSARQA